MQNPKLKTKLLNKLIEIEMFDSVEEFIAVNALDSIVPGICSKCYHTADCEPDGKDVWCENCQEGSVISGLVLADFY